MHRIGQGRDCGRLSRFNMSLSSPAVTGLALVLASLASVPAGADLIGDEIYGTAMFFTRPGVNLFDGGFGGGPDSVSAIVGAGAEFFTGPLGGDATLTVDVGASNIIATIETMNTDYAGSNAHIWLDDLDWLGEPGRVIASVSVVSSEFQYPFLLEWNDHSIHIVGYDQTWDQSDALTAEFQITWGLDPPVPEPASVLLLGLGLAGVALRKHALRRS